MSRYAEDLSDIQETFNMFDTKGDGKISASKLGEVLRASNQNPTELEVRKCGYSQNAETRIPFETFVPILQTVSKNRVTPSLEEMVDGFSVFDKDRNGFMSVAEFRHIMTTLGEPLKDEEVDQLLGSFEESHGFINYEECIKCVLNG